MNSNALKFTKKQMEVFKFSIQKEPQILILAGGKRAGKTFILNYLFLLHIVEMIAVKPPEIRIIMISIGASTIPGIPLKKKPFPNR